MKRLIASSADRAGPVDRLLVEPGEDVVVAGERQHYVQQHVGTGGYSLGWRVLGGIVTDARDTGHEYHAARAYPCEHLCVVAGP